MRVVMVVLALVSSAAAQVTTGSVSGFVLDPSHRPIPNAGITVSDARRSLTRSATTDVTGYFRVADLPPAAYKLSAAAPGFVTTQSPEVQVAVDAQMRVDFNLAISGKEQSLTVQATAAAVASESSELGTVISQDRIAGLPLNQRDFLQLALLTPGVTTPVQGSELASRGGFAMHANGAREEYNNFLLDGVDNNDPVVNRYVLQPSVDSIQEFKIATNAYSAEYARNAGAQVNVITRSGANEIHGFGYEYLRNRQLDATNSFDQSGKAKLIRNQFGAGAGGPILKNRTFFFANFDALRGREGFSQFGTVPTAALRQFDLSSVPGNIIDPFTQAPFPGKTIPSSRISPLASRVLDLYPAATAPGNSGNYFGQPVERDANSQFNGRLDHRFNSADQLTLRYSYGKKDLFEPFTENSVQLPGFGDYVNDTGHSAMIQSMHSFSANAINSLFAGFNRASRNVQPQNYQTDVNKLWGVSYLPTQARDFGYPAINVAGFSQVGDVTQIPIARATTTYQVGDTFSLVWGAHAIKLGGDHRWVQNNGILDLLSRGSISFSGAISGSGISDLLLGFPSFAVQSQSNNPQTQRTASTGVFVQDDWKVSRRLTLNLGVRYEYNTPPVDPTDRMSAFNLSTGKATQVGTNGVTRSGFRPDRNNFAPRIGFAYSPTSSTVVRGGYGIYYDAGMLTVNSAMYFNPPYFNIYVFFPSATSLLSLSNPFPLKSGFVPPASLSTLDPNLVTSYLQSWNFNVQHDIATLGTFSLAYAGSKGTHLIRALDLNQPLPGPGPVASRAPYPQYSNIFFGESGSNSNYHSLQFSFNRRLAKGLSMLAAYTFSKSIDDMSAFLSTTGDRNFAQNSHNYRAERGLSSFDTPQRLVMAYVYSLPFRSALLRHFESGAIITAQSGQPFTPVLQFDNSNTGNTGGNFGSDRPNVNGSPWLANPSPAMWFNTAVFSVPKPYTFGSAGRNILRGPGTASVDLSISRKFQLAERTGLTFEAQAFNLLNRENLNLPNLFADNPATFGKIFSARAPRQVQIALRLHF
jgi:outer membrane receptor protein involved in Fe transport